MLLKILRTLMVKFCKPTYSRNVEDILYPKRVYPIYLQVQSKFNYCIKNRLLKRDDILAFKYLLNSYIKNQNYYKNIKFQNDVHEIYKKLKSHDISAKQMQKLLGFIEQFVIDIPQSTQTVQHLKIIK